MVCKSLELLFRRNGYLVRSVHTPAEALQYLEQATVNLVVLDMNFSIETSGKQGLKTLEKVLELKPGLPVILMTGWATVQLAVEGMKMGARDFLAKPWDNKQLLSSVRTILELTAGNPAADQDNTPERDGGVITQSPLVKRILHTAGRVAATDASVLITGESGTGKELIAERIHATSKRAAGPFVAVNLGGVPEGLFESELFGHKAGAFTDARTDRRGRIELAEGGTLFLDEIGDLTAANQVKLLRVLQERRYARLGESTERSMDVRLLSATSRPLDQLVKSGRFREDLLYRINLIHLHLPPLRERVGDIRLLAAHFLAKAAERYDRSDLRFSEEALLWLERQSFPGNVRQLQNLIEKSAILTEQNIIDGDFLRAFDQRNMRATATTTAGKTLLEVEEKMVRAALDKHGHNITETARELGLTRAALYRRMDKFGIRHDH